MDRKIEEEISKRKGITNEVKDYVKNEIEISTEELKKSILELEEREKEVKEFVRKEIEIAKEEFKSLLELKVNEVKEYVRKEIGIANEGLEKSILELKANMGVLGNGFQHGKTYRIKSVLDGRALDVNRAVENHLVWTWDINNASHAQHWIANFENPGFRLQTKKDNALLAMESKVDNSLVVRKFRSVNIQKFTAECIDDGNFLIKNMENNFALQNRGGGVQVISVPANRNDKSQQWKLIELN